MNSRKKMVPCEKCYQLIEKGVVKCPYCKKIFYFFTISVVGSIAAILFYLLIL